MTNLVDNELLSAINKLDDEEELCLFYTTAGRPRGCKGTVMFRAIASTTLHVPLCETHDCEEIHTVMKSCA